MTLNVNDTEMSLVNVNGTRMEVVNVNGTEVYRAQNGNVTLVLSNDSGGGSFDPGPEDLNRHFVVVGGRFSGGGLPFPSAPSINGVAMTGITAGTSGNFDDGGITGIYTIKIPTGTGTFSVSGALYTAITVYRVTGCYAMTSAVSAATTAGAINGNATSPANGKGCAFAGTVGNFYDPTVSAPVSSGLAAPHPVSDSYHAASNTVTAGAQYIATNGNQISSYAVFAYDLF